MLDKDLTAKVNQVILEHLFENKSAAQISDVRAIRLQFCWIPIKYKCVLSVIQVKRRFKVRSRNRQEVICRGSGIRKPQTGHFISFQ